MIQLTVALPVLLAVMLRLLFSLLKATRLKDLMEKGSDETSEDDDVNGYRLLDMSLLEKFVDIASCPHCKAVCLILEEDSSLRRGLCSFLMAVCRDSGNHIGFYTSQKKGSFMEVN